MDFIVETGSEEKMSELTSLIDDIMGSKKLSYPRLYGYELVNENKELKLDFDKSDSGKVYRLLTSKGFNVK